MLTAIILAGSLPLVTINADDGRLAADKTFVSEKAEMVLAGQTEGEVLCLDRPSDGSICITRKEWSKAVTMANAQPNLRHLGQLLARQVAF
ncbi:hypothetical protein [Parerythrobacter aestuarii]|uniref:hypothetical protein n=1 Tax=Parerythrobacter aestuarii TaxID=3020909 RepID=UPI0024DE94B0|nr:hypothetical protein [Parerythrobacter aestuarii]